MGDHIKEVAILGLVGLETVALLKGIDGVFFGVVIAVIAGIAGYKMKVCKNN